MTHQGSTYSTMIRRQAYTNSDSPTRFPSFRGIHNASPACYRRYQRISLDRTTVLLVDIEMDSLVMYLSGMLNHYACSDMSIIIKYFIFTSTSKLFLLKLERIWLKLTRYILLCIWNMHLYCCKYVYTDLARLAYFTH